MSRSSRFDKLELERKEPAESSEPSHPRFEADALPPPADAGGSADGEPSAPTEARFASGGVSEVQLAQGGLMELATLVCPACSTESARFDVRCYRCGAALDSKESVTLNQARLEALRAQRAEEARQTTLTQQQAVVETARAQAEQRQFAEGLALELGDHARTRLGMTGRGVPAWAPSVAAVIAVLLLRLFAPPWLFRVGALVVVVALLALRLIPRGGGTRRGDR